MASQGPLLPVTVNSNDGSKRKRLTGKQACASVSPPVVQVVPQVVRDVWHGFPDAVEFAKLGMIVQRRRVFSKFEWWLKKIDLDDLQGTAYCSIELLKVAQLKSIKMGRDQSSRTVRYFLDHSKPPDHVLLFGRRKWRLPLEKKEDHLFHLRGSSFLFTYNGDWGKFGVARGHDGQMSAREVEAMLRQMDEVEILWQKFVKFTKWIVGEVDAEYWACSLELCLKTLEHQGEIRVHCHLFLRRDKRMEFVHKEMLQFQTSNPYLRERIYGKHLRKNCFSGMYYLLCPKLGCIYQMGSHERFHEFPVNPDWIFNALEESKMEFEVARDESMRIARGCKRRSEDLDCWNQHRQQLEMAKRIAEAQKLSRSRLQDFPRQPIVDNWLQEVFQPGLNRRRFLVLDGDTQVGKTMYARSLFPIGSVLELNCSGVSCCILTSFCAATHKCILWDEASPSLVCNNRKVFQHQDVPTDLGHSPTGAHVIRVFLGFSCSIITSNSWAADVKKMSESEQKWLAGNTCYLHVKGPLWEQPIDEDLV